MDVAWAILKGDSPVEGHLDRARDKPVERPAVPSDTSEAREVREMVQGDSPQRRLDIFAQRVGRPPSDEEASKLVAEFRAGVPASQSFSADYNHLDDIFG